MLEEMGSNPRGGHPVLLALARLGPSEYSWGMAVLDLNPCLQGEGWQLFPKTAGAVNAGLCRQLCCSFTHPRVLLVAAAGSNWKCWAQCGLPTSRFTALMSKGQKGQQVSPSPHRHTAGLLGAISWAGEAAVGAGGGGIC